MKLAKGIMNMCKSRSIKLFVGRFLKSELDSLEEDEKIILIQLMHVLNELAILQKCILYSSRNIKELEEIKKVAQTRQTLFFVRMLAGKLYEAWELIRKSYFSSRTLSKKYEKVLESEAKNALDQIKKYFVKSDNIVSIIRNKHAFHYDKNKVEEELQKIPSNETLEIYIPYEGRGNSIFVCSEDLINSSILNSVCQSNHEKAFVELMDQIVALTGLFQDFGIGLSVKIFQNIKNVDISDEVVNNVPDMKSVELPFFVSKK